MNTKGHIAEKHEHSLICHESPEEILGRKVFYISDLHLELKNQKGFEHLSDEEYVQHVVRKMDGDGPFGDSPLIILGDVANEIGLIEYFFSVLRLRREGPIVYILGNHEAGSPDKKLEDIVSDYRVICDKHRIVLLQNEVAFFYDLRTDNGEILEFWNKIVLDKKDLLSNKLKLYDCAKKSKMIIFGSIGLGENADGAVDIVDDTSGLFECEKLYARISEILPDSNIIIATHYPYRDWTELDYNSNYIYMNGHTHVDYFEYTNEKTIFADNQVGYDSDDYFLKYFKISGQYNPFINMEDGIHKITLEEYLDFQIGNNIRVKKRPDERQIYMVKKSAIYMFVYYNGNNDLILLNGGAKQRLSKSIEYYYENVETYANGLKTILKTYLNSLINVSYFIKTIGGSGKIHGCIVDINENNHIYINPDDGKITPYYSEDNAKKIVYKDLETLLSDKCPALLKRMNALQGKNGIKYEMPINKSGKSRVISDSSIYNASKIIRRIQYLVFQNVVRYWNDDVLNKLKGDGVFGAITYVDPTE